MNIDKAREYFSSYYEETLELGLRQSLEQRLRSDSQLKAEYEAFVHTMDELSELKFEEIEVPLYLNAKITAKIDEARATRKPNKILNFYLPRFAIAAAAVIAIGGTVVSYFGSSHGQAVHAGLVPATLGSSDSESPAWPMESISVATQHGQTEIHYSSATDRVVEISDDKGSLLKTFDLKARQALTTELSNPNPTATVFKIHVSDNGPDEMIVTPGSKAGQAGGDQSGDLVAFGKSMADKFSTPVVLSVKDDGRSLVWNLDSGDESSNARKVFEGHDYESSLTSTGVLSITGH